MQDLILYLLKSAGLISLFFAGYFFLLKNDTTFNTNRFFLLAGILTSILLPFLEITRTIEAEAVAVSIFFENISAGPTSDPKVPNIEVDWWQLIGVVYLLGFGFFLLKFLTELFSLFKLIYTHKAEKKGGFYIIRKSGITQPFSFFKYIVFDPDQHTPVERDLILKHECSHARQWHSIDQLLTSLSVSLLWFNPLAWLYRKSVVQNLEYLVDKEVVAAQVSKKEYQKTLLKITVTGFQPALTNQFYQSFIKKRIMMLNRNNTQKSNFWKTSLLLPFILLFIFIFNVQTVAQVVDEEITTTSEVEISATISKKTTKETFSQFEKLFKKRGVILKFENPEYSGNGMLTAVQISYYNPSTGASGNIALNDPSGIEPTVIYTNKKETGFRPGKDLSTAETSPVFGELGKEPLFIIAGKERSAKSLLGKKIQITGEMNVIDPEEAITRYGKKAESGAVILSQALVVDDIKEVLKEMDLQNKNMKSTFIEVRKDSAPILYVADIKISKNNPSFKSDFSADDFHYGSKSDDILAIHLENENTIIYNFQENKPLVLIDGEEQKDFNSSDLEPSIIKSINVLKDHNAVEKYGDRAKNGAIEIILKSEEEMKTSSEETKRKEKGKIYFSAHTLRFEDSDDKRSTRLSVRDVGSADPDALNRLYVIDGKVMDEDFDFDSIAPNEIESITVLKGDKATAKYGQKAQYGVIEIITVK